MRHAVCLLFYCIALCSEAQNLIKNPDCELPLQNGKIPFWVEEAGTRWVPKSAIPLPQSGNNYFFAGEEAEAELSQTIGLDDYICLINQGTLRLEFTGYTRSFFQEPPDQSHLIIELLSTNSAILTSEDLGVFSTINQWNLVSKVIQVPTLTRKVKIRLLSHRKNGIDNDGYFDDLSLVAVSPPIPATQISKTICPGESFMGRTVSGLYTDSLKTSGGCDSVVVLNLSVTPLPTIQFTSVEEICLPQALEVAPNLTPANLPVSYRWSTGESTPAISVRRAGTYELTVGNNACTTKASVTIREGAVLKLKADESLCLSSPTLVLESGTTESGLAYLWTPSGATTPTVAVSQAGQYQVRVTSPGGCEATRTIQVKEGPCFIQAFLPNSFTPNSDGINDVLRAIIVGGTAVSLRILDRWGSTLHIDTGSTPQWDGQCRGKDCPTGNYVYVLRYQDTTNGTVYEKQGTILLLK